jgi:hypothetical protein
MASDKKKAKAAKKPTAAAGPVRHPDGDRRRRGGPSAKEAVAFKRRMREAGMPPEGDATAG